MFSHCSVTLYSRCFCQRLSKTIFLLSYGIYFLSFGDLPAALVPFKPSNKFNNSYGDSKGEYL